MSKVARMGVIIPDNFFPVIDVVRELEKSRTNIPKKCDGNEKQQASTFVLLMELERNPSPLNTNWMNDMKLMRIIWLLLNLGGKERRK